MAKEYLEKLSHLISELNIPTASKLPMKTERFFSGAVLYVNKAICASWSPVGLAFNYQSTKSKS